MGIFQTIQAVGIGGAFAILVIDKVFEFVGKKDRFRMEQIVRENHITLKIIANTLKTQTDILNKMSFDCDRCRDEINKISGKMNGRS